ncbi:MAG: hypothetical protein B7Z10_02435 [Rhodobacterales bacterium 32-66-7]|nr:MAG: hypothetical protein B7Z31_01415 [Rhodobacterales bacterium 12-65-15]OYX26757.1 MAG: hypothetical protein B7Z10_02435 [Rhodobacterales bacterium 32-66-7]
MTTLKRFWQEEAGAVTVDFVVLTAGVVVLTIVVAPPIREAVVNLAIGIGDTVNDVEVGLPPG